MAKHRDGIAGGQFFSTLFHMLLKTDDIMNKWCNTEVVLNQQNGVRLYKDWRFENFYNTCDREKRLFSIIIEDDIYDGNKVTTLAFVLAYVMLKYKMFSYWLTHAQILLTIMLHGLIYRYSSRLASRTLKYRYCNINAWNNVTEIQLREITSLRYNCVK